MKWVLNEEPENAESGEGQKTEGSVKGSDL
jgi:hypothetical protein